MLCLMHIYLLCVCTIDYWLCIFHYTFSCFLCILDVLFLGISFPHGQDILRKFCEWEKTFGIILPVKFIRKCMTVEHAWFSEKKKEKKREVMWVKKIYLCRKKRKHLECFKIIRLKCIFFVFYADFGL